MQSTAGPKTARAQAKIVATVGPACRAPEMLAALIEAGADVFRLNMAHASRPEHEQVLADLRRISREAGRPVGVLVDLAGPKIRLGGLFTDPTDCPVGSTFQFVRGSSPTATNVLVSNYPRLVDELAVGNSVMLADGTVAMTVVAKEAQSVTCRVTGAGQLRSKQGINLPGAKLGVKALTDEDLANAQWAARVGADFVSLSFVRSPVEVLQLKDILRSHGSRAWVIAKIEKQEALEKLDDIVAAADGVMVARGDLGVEIDVAEIAVAQKRIVAACGYHRKPVIVATQMLDSMHHSRRPTRAEATDVANAVLDGADACMLSGETAIGEFPRETVEMMNRIMLATEQMARERPLPPQEAVASEGVHPITSAVVFGASRIAERLAAKMMVISTRTCGTARVKAKQRDFVTTIGVSDEDETLRHMCLLWGIRPLPNAPVQEGADLRKFIVDWGLREGSLHRGDRIVFVTGTGLVQRAHNLVVVHEVE